MTRDEIQETIAFILLNDRVRDDETARDILDTVEPMIRADEDERIARKIENLPYDLRTGSQRISGMLTATRAWAYIKCARIARGYDG